MSTWEMHGTILKPFSPTLKNHRFSLRFNLIETCFEVLLIASLIVFSSFIFFPGGMSGDSVDQWRQVLHIDQVNNFNPPAMVYIWWIIFNLTHQMGGLLVFHFTLYWISLLVFSHVFFERLLSRIAFILGIGLFPPIFIMNGTLWKDVSMLCSLSLAVSLLFMYSKNGNKAIIIGGFLLLIYGLSVRHNAIFASFPIIYYFMTRRLKSDCKHTNTSSVIKEPKALQMRCLFSALLVLLLFGVVQFINKYKVDDKRNISNSVFIWDLWGMSVLLGQNLLPMYLFKENRASEIQIDFLKNHYKPYTNSVIWIYTHLRDDKWNSSFPDRRFKMDLLKTLVSHPLAYLTVRLRLFYYLLGFQKDFLFFHHYIQIAHFSKHHYLYPFTKNISMKNPGIIAFIKKTASFLHKNTLLYSTWVYASLSALLLLSGLKLRHYRNEILTLLFSGIFYWLPYFFIAPGAEFRYNNWLIFMTMLSIPIFSKSVFLSWKNV